MMLLIFFKKHHWIGNSDHVYKG